MQKLIEKIYLSLTVNAQGKGVQLEGRTIEKPYCYGHVMILAGISKGNLMIIHQTSYGDGSKGTYEEVAPDRYKEPFEKCGFVIHIKDQSNSYNY